MGAMNAGFDGMVGKVFWEIGYPQERGHYKEEEKIRRKWGDTDFLPLQTFPENALFLLHSYSVSHSFPKILKSRNYWESSSTESIFPTVYLLPELAEVYFLVLQRPSFFLPSSNVVYLISCRVGNYVQNLCDPLSIVSYACSDKYMPQGLEIISAMCCCRLLIKIGWKKNIIFRCEKPSPLSNNFSCIFPKTL